MLAELLTRRNPLAPATLDMEAGTVDAVLSTGAAVRRNGFVERLTISPDSVELADHIPLLDGHRQGSIGDVLGRVSNIRLEGGSYLATLHVSNANALAAIQRGDVRGVSIGYAPLAFTDSRDAKTGEKIRTVTKWGLREVSLVPVGADPGALTRSIQMEDEIETTEIISDTLTRAETNTQIRGIATAAGLGTTFADDLIDREATLLEARAAAFEQIQSRNPVRITVGTSHDDSATLVTRQAEALACQLLGTEPSDAARQFMGLELSDHARLCVTRAGVTGTANMGREALVTRAMHVTTDFANLLTGTGTRMLLASYQAAESPLKQLAVQRNLPDFRPGSMLRIGGMPALKKVTEAGEIKYSSTGEAAEGFKLDTYASIFALSRQAIINDDLGAFAQWSLMAGRAAAETEAEAMIGLLREAAGLGPVMQDGKRLFHVDHGNLSATGDAPDVEAVSAARLALRKQTGLDGVTPINARPKYLVVAADLETAGEQLLAALAAATLGEVNPFSGKLTLAVEPRLPDGEWYVFADPAVLPTLAYGYLSGAPGPQLANRDGWDVLGREFRVVLDFGCGAVDWRGAYRNPGEAL